MNNTASVLIIDDEDMIRDFVREVLERKGYTVYDAADGVKGLALMQQNKIDIIITDLIMPEKEGIETIMELRSLHPRCGVIAMSGAMNSIEYLQMADELGADATLAKPFKSSDLLMQLESVMSTRMKQQ